MKMKKLMLVVFSLSLIGLAGASYLEQECLYQREGSYITSVHAGDLLGDGKAEIFAGSDNGQVMDFTYAGCRKQSRQWSPVWQYIQKISNKGDIIDIVIDDLEGDGKKELFVAANTREEYFFLMSNDGIFKWADEKVGSLVLSMDVVDIDDDKLVDIIVGTEGNTVVALEGENKIKWKTNLDNEVYFVEALDVNDDGSLEIIALTNKYLESASVYVLDSSGRRLWNYSIDEGIYRASENTISIGDIDNDKKQEIAVATYKKGVIILEHNGGLRWMYPTERLVNSVHISDLNADDKPEIIFSSNPYLYFLDDQRRELKKTHINGSALIIQSADLEGDGQKEVVVGTKDRISIIGWDGIERGAWSIGKDVDALSLHLSDLDNDGKKEIIAGYGWSDARLDQKYTSGELTILRATGTADTTTTAPQTTTVQTTTTLETTTTHVPTQKTKASTTTTEPEGEGSSNTLMLLIVIGVAVLALSGLVIVLIITRRKKEEPTKEERLIEDIIEEKQTTEKETEKEEGAEVEKE